MNFLRLFLILGILSPVVKTETNYKIEISLPNKEKLITAQESEYWCWAASLEAIYKYNYNISVEQVAVVKHIHNLKFIKLLDYITDKTSLPVEQNFLDKYFSSFREVKQIKIQDIRAVLKRGNPIIAIYQSHAVVVTGYENFGGVESYEVMDPYYKIGKYKPFQRLAKNEILYRSNGQSSIFVEIVKS